MKHYDRWWYSPDAPDVRIDLDHITSRHSIVSDPNADRIRYVLLDYKCPDGRVFTGKQTHEVLWLDVPPARVVWRSARAVAWTSAAVMLELAWILLVSRVLVGLSPIAASGRMFARAVGLMGYALVPMVVIVCFLLPTIAMYVTSNLWPRLTFTVIVVAVSVPSALWIGYIAASLPKLVLAERDRGMRTFYGVIILGAQLLLLAVALLVL
ncbi:MAG: hypothetical protein ACKVS9_02975 [Phycisphaerae bacterium]